MLNILLKKVRDTITSHNMLKYGDRVVVGVSAGPDSVCLLYLLNDLKDDYNLSLHIAHLHHGFRGKEADEDVRFVQSLSKALGIPAHIEHIDVPSYIKKTKLSKQAGAREVRYKFFNRIADDIGAAKIALGHTADDQAETFLMRLLKGSGLHGLTGIAPVRERIIRPLIEISREEIKEYLSERDIRYRIDSSNLSPVYLRNKIRLELIPYLAKEYNPNIMDTLIRNLKILREEDIFLNGFVDRTYSQVLVRKSDNSVILDSSKLTSINLPVRRRVIRRAIYSLSGESAITLSYKHVEDSLALLDNDRGEVHLPCGIVVRKERETFGIYLRPEEEAILQYTYNVNIPGETIIPEAGITIRSTILDVASYTKHEEVHDSNNAIFDMGKFSLPLTIRDRRSGDLFYPKGMRGNKKKIKKYFIDLKVPRSERSVIPVLVSPEGILWIVGYRTDERFVVTDKSERILQITVFKKAA